MKQESVQRLLVVYSGALTVMLAGSFLVGFGQTGSPTRFGEINVQRINIVGPDGKTQMVISNRQDMPEAILDGKTFESHGRHEGAGMIFYNAEGDEDGGLTFSGKKTAAGHSAGGGLLFDQFKQDQTVGLVYEDANGNRAAGLRVWDRPNTDLADVMEKTYLPIQRMPDGPEKKAALDKLRAAGAFGASRVFVGKTTEEKAEVQLDDAQGHPRLRLSVTPAGEAAVEFLDAAGAVTYRVAAPKK